VLKTNQPQLLHFGVSNETAWDVGLACGGTIEIFVNPFHMDLFQALRSVLKDGCLAVLITVVRGPADVLGHELLMREDGHTIGTLGSGWDERVSLLARESLSQGVSRRFQLSEGMEIFIEVILPLPTLIVVGGVHIAIALIALAKILGYRTILIDPRKAWGNPDRFPHVAQLIQAWPDEAFRQIRVTRSTAIAMLTHDPKLDDLALKIALPSPAFYVGALGSQSTQISRHERLREAGLTETQLSRLHGPIGLKIGSETPEEIALAIMAEIVDAYRKQAQQDVKADAVTSQIV
jgi:xanthine dehydrogenase accessory factor